VARKASKIIGANLKVFTKKYSTKPAAKKYKKVLK